MRFKKAITLLAVVLFFCAALAAGIHFFGLPDFSAEPEDYDTSNTRILVFKDIQYGQHENQTFDLNLPVDYREETGLVLFLHGGGWISGDKSASRDSYSVFNANKGYATASMNYRFVNDGESTIFDIIDDITLALSQIKAFAAGYSVNLSKVILCGHSAGGHLSMLYAYKYKDVSPIEPVGVFASAPVPDLALDSFFTNNILGNEKYMCDFISQLLGTSFTPKTRAEHKALLDEHSPIKYVSRSTVPTVVLHGNRDRIAPYEGSVLLMEKLKQYSVKHELVIFENTGHSLRDKEKKQYASELMLACVKEWFNLK